MHAPARPRSTPNARASRRCWRHRLRQRPKPRFPRRPQRIPRGRRCRRRGTPSAAREPSPDLAAALRASIREASAAHSKGCTGKARASSRALLGFEANGSAMRFDHQYATRSASRPSGVPSTPQPPANLAVPPRCGSMTRAPWPARSPRSWPTERWWVRLEAASALGRIRARAGDRDAAPEGARRRPGAGRAPGELYRGLLALDSKPLPGPPRHGSDGRRGGGGASQRRAVLAMEARSRLPEAPGGLSCLLEAVGRCAGHRAHGDRATELRTMRSRSWSQWWRTPPSV